MSYIGKRIATNGILQLQKEDNTYNIFISTMNHSFKTSGLENCQTVFGSEVIFIGTFVAEDTINIEAIDDLPSENICSEMSMNSGDSSFIAIINSGNAYLAAFATDRGSSYSENGEIYVSCNIGDEKLEACLGEVKGLTDADQDKIDDWFYDHICILSGIADNIVVNNEEKMIKFIKAKHKLI